jgi:hypothetical protein
VSTRVGQDKHVSLLCHRGLQPTNELVRESALTIVADYGREWDSANTGTPDSLIPP